MSSDQPEPAYSRVLLKLSGEALSGEAGYGIEPDVVQDVAEKVRSVAQMGVQVAIVVGGGNIFRGMKASAEGMDRASADYIGMIATVQNALALQDMLEKNGVQTRVMTAIEMHQVAEPYIRRRAIRHMEKGRVVIMAGGTGNPYFTTDTTAALRAMEVGADVILMEKNRVDGVYDSDPRTNPHAVKFDHLSYQEAITKNLRVMDATALTLCRDNKMPIIVFNMQQNGNIERVVRGEHVGTRIS